MKLETVRVEYMDGSVITYRADEEEIYPTVTISPISTLYAPEDLRVKISP